MPPNQLPVLVVGGGISMPSTAIEKTEPRSEVVLVESETSLTWRVARAHP